MQNYEDAAIRMPEDLNDCQIIIPIDSLNHHFGEVPVRPPFDDLVISFLDTWSKELSGLPNIADESGLLTFAFWCRRAHIESLKKKHVLEHRFSLGRGLVFHIASKNMPLNVGYTLAIGLLAGNANIVKLATRRFSQTDVLVETLKNTLQNSHYQEIADSIGIIRYDMEKTSITDTFSKICNVRLIWGGDDTIERIRQSPIRPQAYEICFFERYSLCIIATDDLDVETDYHSLAQGLYNDIYLFDQNAFTAPHLIVWLGSNAAKRELVKERIWNSLLDIVIHHYPANPAVSADKLMIMCREAIETGSCTRIGYKDNRLFRIRVKRLENSLYYYKGLGGLLHEKDISSLDELSNWVDYRVQTLSYWGIDKTQLHSWIVSHRIPGIDRIVPIGQTAEFDSIWDGFDLVGSLSRIIT